MARRRWAAIGIVLGGLTAGFLSLPATVSASGIAMQPLCFVVLRDGSDIGRHRIHIARNDGLTTASIAIDLDISFGPLNLFSYRHRSREVWRGSRLIAIETRTNDDGDRFFVSGRATADGFVVNASGGRVTLPLDIVPTSYWREDVLGREHWLDTQRGAAIELSVRRRDPAASDGSSYDLSGDLNLAAGYDIDGRWRSLSFAARGAEVRYRSCEEAETRAGWAFALEDAMQPATRMGRKHD